MYGQLVKEYKSTRKRKGVTQEDVSSKADVSPFTISRMENGESIPRLDKFIEMAKGIGMMVALVPFPAELPPEPKVEEVVEEEDIVVDNEIDNWTYDTED